MTAALAVAGCVAGVIAIAMPLGTVEHRARRRPPPVGDLPSEPRRGPAPVRRRRAVMIALAVGAYIALGPLITLAATGAVIFWPRARQLLVARADRRAIDAALPDAIELLILVVHAGLTPHQAVVLLADRAPLPVRPAFVETRRRVERGAPLAEALLALPALLGPSAAVLADTLGMAERYGTPVAEALVQLGHDVRERRRRLAEADARKLPIRMSFPLVACTLPAFVLLAIVPAVLAALSSLGDTGF